MDPHPYQIRTSVHHQDRFVNENGIVLSRTLICVVHVLFISHYTIGIPPSGARGTLVPWQYLQLVMKVAAAGSGIRSSGEGKETPLIHVGIPERGICWGQAGRQIQAILPRLMPRTGRLFGVLTEF